MTRRTVGIIGGMGPEATVDFQQRLVRHTRAGDDADHIRCLVDNNPHIPSRIRHLIDGTGSNPLPVLAQMARALERWGSDFLVIPCNTAHYYYDGIQAAVSVPVLNLVELVADRVAEMIPLGSAVGILGSTAIINTRLYEAPFVARGIRALYPAPAVQNRLFDLIRAVKAGCTGQDSTDALGRICGHLAENGAALAVIACTELGIVCGPDLPLKLIDAADVLARATVAASGGTLA